MLFCTAVHFLFLEEKQIRIILDTDKKQIIVPWNYQQKLDGINEIIMQVSQDETKKKTFTGYIDELGEECIKNSDKCVITGDKPFRKREAEKANGKKSF